MGTKTCYISNRLSWILENDYAPLRAQVGELYNASQVVYYGGCCHLEKNLDQLAVAVRSLEPRIIDLMHREEKRLYPFIETHIPRFEPILCLLLSEHDDFKKLFRNLGRSLALLRKNKKRPQAFQKGARGISEDSAYLAYFLKSHLWVEDMKIFKALRDELHISEKEKLVRILAD